jgi:hypothetical protein
MPFHVRDAGTWKAITAPQVRDAGTWKAVQEGWVRDAGTWKQFFASASVNIANKSIYSAGNYPNSTYVEYALLSSGQARKTEGVTQTNFTNEWQNPVGSLTSSNYEVRSTHVSGTNIGGHGTWLGLGSNRIWAQTVGGGQGDEFFTSVFDIEIRLAASPFTVVGTARITLAADYIGNN